MKVYPVKKKTAPSRLKKKRTAQIPPETSPDFFNGVYFDNAATSFPKPPSVYEAVAFTLKHVGANPGRGKHSFSRSASKVIFEARETIADFFNVPDSRNIIFTSNGTEAINLALKGLLKQGDHVITSSMEHNAVVRPLNSLKNSGVSITNVQCDKEGNLNPDSVRKEIKKNTRLIVLTHASNVTGTIMPVEEVGDLAEKNGVPFLVDAAQTAGAIPIDVPGSKISLLAAPGHKSLLGPQGTGFLYISKELDMKPLIEGGTGSNSEMPEQPDFLPDRFESGTLNTPGIAGLKAGIEFVKKKTIKAIRDHENSLCEHFIGSLNKIDSIRLYGPLSKEERTAVISFNVREEDPARIADMLDQKYQIMVRVGLHCAPNAHKTIGTFPEGTIRVSFSIFNRLEEVDYFIASLKKVIAS